MHTSQDRTRGKIILPEFDLEVGRRPCLARMCQIDVEGKESGFGKDLGRLAEPSQARDTVPAPRESFASAATCSAGPKAK